MPKGLKGAVKKEILANKMGAKESSQPRDVALVRVINSNARSMIASRRSLEEDPERSNTPSTASGSATRTTTPTLSTAPSTANGTERRASDEGWAVVRDIKRATKSAMMARMFTTTASQGGFKDCMEDTSALRERLAGMDAKAAADKEAAKAKAAADAEAAARAAADAANSATQDGQDASHYKHGEGADDGTEASLLHSGLYDGNLLDGSRNPKDGMGSADQNDSLSGHLGSGDSSGSGYGTAGTHDGSIDGGGAAGANGRNGLGGESLLAHGNSDHSKTDGQNSGSKMSGLGTDDHDGDAGTRGKDGLGTDSESGLPGYNSEDDEEAQRRRRGQFPYDMEDEMGSRFKCTCSNPALKNLCPKCGNCRTCGIFNAECEDCIENVKRVLLEDTIDWRITPIFDTLRLAKVHGISGGKLADLFSTLGIDRGNITAEHVAAVLVCILIGKGNETAEQLSVVFNALGVNKDNLVMKDLLPLFHALSINKDNVMKKELEQLFCALGIDRGFLTVEQLQSVLGALDIHQDSITANHVEAVFGALGIHKETVTVEQMTILFTALDVNKDNVHPLHILALFRGLRIDQSNVTAALITSLFSTLGVTTTSITEDHLCGLCQALGIEKSHMTHQQVAIIFKALCEEQETVSVEQMSALVCALGIDVQDVSEGELSVLIRASGIDKNNMVQNFKQAVVILEALCIGNNASKAGQHLAALFRALDIDTGNETQQKMSALYQAILIGRDSKILSQMAAVFEALGTDVASIGIDIDSITPQHLAAMLAILGNSIDQITAQQSDQMASIFGALGKESTDEQHVDDLDKDVDRANQREDTLEKNFNCDISMIEPCSERKAIAKKMRTLIHQTDSSLQKRHQEAVESARCDKEDLTSDLSWLDNFSMDKVSISKAEKQLDEYRQGLDDCIASGAWQPPWLGGVVPGSECKLRHSHSTGGLDRPSGNLWGVLHSHVNKLVQPVRALKAEAKNPSSSRKTKGASFHQHGAVPNRVRKVETQFDSSAIGVEQVMCSSLAEGMRHSASKVDGAVSEQGQRWESHQGIRSSPALLENQEPYGQAVTTSKISIGSASPKDCHFQQRRASSLTRSQPLLEKAMLELLESPAVTRQHRCKSMKRGASSRVGHLRDNGSRNVWYSSLRESNSQKCYDPFRPKIIERPKFARNRLLGSDAKSIRLNALQLQLSS